MPGDDRFDTSNWDNGDGEWSGLAGPSSEPAAEDHDVDMAESDNAKGKGKILKPLTPEALAAFEAAQKKAGIIYISRIPPGMRPQKLRHIMSGYGEVGRIYMAFEDPKSTHDRRKYTNSKTTHAHEGWVEFTDKAVARSVADMLNGQPVGGKRGDRYRDDVWTMKYLPKFKWNMLTEQLRHDKAVRTARLRIELSRSTREQEDYLKQVSLAKTLESRAKRKAKKNGRGGKEGEVERPAWTNVFEGPPREDGDRKKAVKSAEGGVDEREKEERLRDVLGKVF